MVKTQKHSKKSVNKGAWTAEEDRRLSEYIRIHGDKKWRTLPARAGLSRCGKSCRLRWLNYLRPDIKRGNISDEEEDLIMRLHNLLGNRWSLIAGRLPGRTDNEIKNYWNTHLGKKSLSMNELNHKINSKIKRIEKSLPPIMTCPASSNPEATNEKVAVDRQRPWSDLLDNDLEDDQDVDIDRIFDFVGSDSAGTDQGLSNSILDDKQVFEANAGMFSELLDYGFPAMELSYEESKFDQIDLDTLSRFLDSDLSHPSGDLSLVL